MIHASSTDRASKASQSLTIKMNGMYLLIQSVLLAGGLDADEIEKMRLEAERNIEYDKKQQEAAQVTDITFLERSVHL